MSRRNVIADYGAALSAVMFVASLCLPGLVYLAPRPDAPAFISGVAIFASGWARALSLENFAWLANPLALISFFWVLRDLHPRLSAKLAAAAFLISFHALAYDKTLLDAGGAVGSVRVGLGFWLWQASMLSLALTRLPLVLKSRPSDALGF